jgi:hypothetical protein
MVQRRDNFWLSTWEYVYSKSRRNSIISVHSLYIFWGFIATGLTADCQNFINIILNISGLIQTSISDILMVLLSAKVTAH